MTKNSNSVTVKNTSTNPKPKRKLKWYILLGTFLVLVGIFLANDIPARIKYAETYNEMVRLKEIIAKQTDFVDQPGGERRGDGFISMLSCLPDVSCPTVSGGGFVAVEKGKELEFVRNLLNQLGYKTIAGGKNPCSLDKTSACGIIGSKLTHTLDIDITKTNIPPSDSIPTVKIWRHVGIRVTK